MTNVHWEELQRNLQPLKLEFDKSFKCLNKARLPSENTILKLIKILVTQHNLI